LASARRAQVASLDLILSAIALLFFIALVLIILPMLTDTKKPKAFYGGEIFATMESMDHPILTDYHVDEANLELFANDISQMDIKLLGNSPVFNPGDSDVCIYFIDNHLIHNHWIEMEIQQTVPPATVPSPVKTLSSAAGGCSTAKPCSDKAEAFVFVKPVVRNEKIVDMYAVVCRE
jgi:hypothetical protein